MTKIIICSWAIKNYCPGVKFQFRYVIKDGFYRRFTTEDHNMACAWNMRGVCCCGARWVIDMPSHLWYTPTNKLYLSLKVRTRFLNWKIWRISRESLLLFFLYIITLINPCSNFTLVNNGYEVKKCVQKKLYQNLNNMILRLLL